MTAQTNWAGNYTYRAERVLRPRTLAELATVVASGGGTLQVLGSRHSFTGIGDADALIDLTDLDGAREIDVDSATATVTVGPAVTYAELATVLNEQGLALANLASLPHISVAGAIATASHGSGNTRGNLATQVAGVELLSSSGEILDLSRADGDDDGMFDGAVVGLGKLGVVTRVRLHVEPYYELRQDVFEGLGWSDLLHHLDAVTEAGQSVSVFHRFGERPREVWIKHDGRGHALELMHELGATPAGEPRNPVPGGDPDNATPQLGEPGPWSERLPHFRSGFTPSSGEEIQSEFFVARADAAAAIAALLPLAPLIEPILHVAELRTVAADTLWLSPNYERDSVALHFTWHRAPHHVARVVAQVEAALDPLDARPHWGKVFTAPAATLDRLYPRMDDFRALRERLDPRGRFANEWLREHGLGPTAWGERQDPGAQPAGARPS